MKKSILFLGLLISTKSFSQITLTDQHFAGSNESFIFSIAQNQSIDFSSTGAAYNWDFSNLTSIGQRDFSTRPMSQASGFSQLLFGFFAPTPYKATYFASTTEIPIDQLTANLPISINDISQFTKKTSSNITSIGYELLINQQGIAVKSDTIETRYILPLNFGSNYTSNGYTLLDMNPIYDAQWKQHRYRESTVDGYGSITTPFGTFEVLRIHHTITELDTLFFSDNGNPVAIPLPIPVSHEYEWRSQDDHEAILKITTHDILGIETVSNIEYRDVFNGLGIENNNLSFEIFPNPSTDFIQFKLSSEAKEYAIIDSRGIIISQKQLNSKETNIDVRLLPIGEYTIVLSTERGICSKKFIKN